MLPEQEDGQGGLQQPLAGRYYLDLKARWQGKKPPQQEVLMAVFADNYVPRRAPAGEPFAVDVYRSPSVAIPLKGTGGLRQRLAVDVFMITGSMPGQEAQSTVLAMIEGVCAQVGSTTRRSLRVARAPDGNIVLDLGRQDGQVAVVNAGGWWLAPCAPVLFRRSAATPELPVPVRADDGKFPGAMRWLVNIRGQNELALYTACRLISAVPEGTRPVELMTGQPGAIKTGTTRITTSWLGGAMAAMPRDPRDWVAMAASAHTLGYDNISGLSADRQDLLCKAASGHEHLARMLYTDAEVYGIKFQPLTVVLNGVEVGMLRSDLIRRAVSHYLLRPDRYASDRQVEAAWQQAHPRALGWLLDVLVAVLKAMEQVPAPAADSLPDFAHILASLDSLWGTRALEMWRGGQRELYENLAEDDALAIAIRKVINGPFEGKPKELLELLQSRVLMAPPAPGREWTPFRLSGRLDRAQAALEALGWKVERERDEHTKNRTIRLCPPSGTAPLEAPATYTGLQYPPSWTGGDQQRGDGELPPGWSRTGITESWSGRGLRRPDGSIYYPPEAEQRGDIHKTWSGE
jgi:hypothetical protein